MADQNRGRISLPGLALPWVAVSPSAGENGNQAQNGQRQMG